MLSLTEVQAQIKSGNLGQARRNGGHLVTINDLYKQLKALGWQCLDREMHPMDRVPVFRLGPASIRRDKQQAGGWIVTYQGREIPTTADLEEITTEVRSKMEIDPADLAAAELIAEYGHDFEGRVERAAELVKAGQTDFPQYETSFDPSGFYGLRSCQCPDAQHRNPRAKFGAACKHCLAQELAARIGQEAEAVNTREWVEEAQRKRESERATMARQAQWAAAHPVDDYGLEERTLVRGVR